MATNRPDKNDGVAGHPGAPPAPLAQPTPAPDPNSLPWTPQQSSPSFFLPPPCNYPSEPDEWLNISALDNDDAMNASVFSYIDYLNASLPPLSDATPFAPFVQPAMPPPSQQQHRYPSQPDEELSIPALGNNDAMNASLFGDSYFNASSPPPPSSATQVAPSVQPAMQPLHYSQQLPAMATMGETQYYYPGAAPEHAVLPDAPPPPAVETTKPAGGRRRGRPRGSTAKSKPKSKVANTTAAAGRRQQEAATASAIIARQETVGAGSAEVEEEQKVVEYADTNIPGVRFKPTDAEIIWYLERKYHGHPLPVNFIQEFDVFEDHPDTVQEKYGESQEGVWYVFSSRDRKYKNGTRPVRSVGTVGFWKSSGKEEDVLDKNNVKIGRVNALTFKLGHQPKGTSTPWRLKEYRMEKYQKDPNPSSMLLDPWVICKLYRAKDPPAGQHDLPVQAGDQPDEGDEHASEANGRGGEDGNQPPNGPEPELGMENCYFSLDDFTHGDPKDQ
ncbi:hypothetical protein ACQJBY_052302 [Aegilops geniculata]